MPDTSENRPDSTNAISSWVGLGLHKPVLPETGELVIVQCHGFRCLAYFDSNRKWRNVKTTREITDVTGWWGIGDDKFTPLN